MPAESHMLSLFSFHFRGVGILKPAGGGPSTGLCLAAPVENAAERATVALRREVVGRERASAVRARGDDIVGG